MYAFITTRHLRNPSPNKNGTIVPVSTSKAYIGEGREIQLHSFLISTPDEEEWSISRSGHFIPTFSPPHILNKEPPYLLHRGTEPV
jgi:hypothetical protein